MVVVVVVVVKERKGDFFSRGERVCVCVEGIRFFWKFQALALHAI